MFRFSPSRIELLNTKSLFLAQEALEGSSRSQIHATDLLKIGKRLLAFAFALPFAKICGIPVVQSFFDDPLHYMSVYGAILSIVFVAFPRAKRHEAQEAELARRNEVICSIGGKKFLFDLATGLKTPIQ